MKVRAAILGSGNIGTDLMIKVMRSDLLECTAFIGRNLSSPGLAKGRSLGINISADGINYIKRNPENIELVFDATSAMAHQEHAPILEKLGMHVIDLTPANIGAFCVPAVNIGDCLSEKNINMVTCGGQASIPIVFALGQCHDDIEYIEVISSIASRSAGPATRHNLDEYIHITEEAIRRFSGCHSSKAILNLNPAIPCINMQTTVFAKVNNPDLPEYVSNLKKIVAIVKSYVPGYEIIVEPKIDNDRIVTMIRVTGLGDYLPAFAGNLDIINCAAIAAAEKYAVSVN